MVKQLDRRTGELMMHLAVVGMVEMLTSSWTTDPPFSFCIGSCKFCSWTCASYSSSRRISSHLEVLTPPSRRTGTSLTSGVSARVFMGLGCSFKAGGQAADMGTEQQGKNRPSGWLGFPGKPKLCLKGPLPLRPSQALSTPWQQTCRL